MAEILRTQTNIQSRREPPLNQRTDYWSPDSEAMKTGGRGLLAPSTNKQRITNSNSGSDFAQTTNQPSGFPVSGAPLSFLKHAPQTLYRYTHLNFRRSFSINNSSSRSISNNIDNNNKAVLFWNLTMVSFGAEPGDRWQAPSWSLEDKRIVRLS